MPSEKISKEGRRQGRVQRKRDVQFFDSGVLGVLLPAPSVANEQELQILIRLQQSSHEIERVVADPAFGSACARRWRLAEFLETSDGPPPDEAPSVARGSASARSSRPRPRLASSSSSSALRYAPVASFPQTSPE
jgi:hypothetical protein